MRIHQGCVPTPFLFVVVVDVVIQLARKDVLSELLYVSDF